MANSFSVPSCCGGGELKGFNVEVVANPPPYSTKSIILAYSDAEKLNCSKETGRSGKSWLVFSYAWPAPGLTKNPTTIYEQHATALGPTASLRECNSRFKKFKRYIERNKLGSVTIMAEHKLNPHMADLTYVKCGVWVPDNEAITTFVTKTKKWREVEQVYCNGEMW